MIQFSEAFPDMQIVVTLSRLVAFCHRNGNSMQILSRYESTIEKNLYKAIHELQRIQAQRMGLPVMAPIA